MGKDFYKEICELSNTYQESINGNVDPIISFLNSIDDETVLTVGSGGSFSSASIFSLFLNHIGIISKAITPLELETYENALHKTSVVLFTASGRNTDVINAYNLLSNSECKNILTVCLRENSLIKQKQKSNSHNFFCEFQLPIVKDGFLAVNTLFSTTILLSQALFKYTNDSFFALPCSYKDLPQISDNCSNEIFEDVLSQNTIIVLHNGITTPVAIDLESKFGEVGLGNIQIVNFRNFAHGRHCWISNNLETTSIIALVGKSEKELAKKTLNVLPESLSKYVIHCNEDNVKNILSLFVRIFEITGIAGEIRGVNPGKPKVSSYGKKLYHISYLPNFEYKKFSKNVIMRSLYRKFKSYNVLKDDVEATKVIFDNFEKTTFDSIVFDFDGTLYDKRFLNITSNIFEKINNLLENNIEIIIATGRGKSVRTELQKYIIPKFWDDLKIGYYNGQIVKALSDNSEVNSGIEAFEPLSSFHDDISNFCNNQGISLELRPLQITIQTDGFNRTKVKKYLLEKITWYNELKCVCSDHSIDIIPKSATKLDVMKQLKYSTKNTLCVGDSGQLGGNDFELLSHPFSLSCDFVSNSLCSCWNYAPLSTRGLEATLYYLDNIIMSDKGFKIKIK